MGDFFVAPRTAITKTDQRTVELRWIAMETQGTNDEHMNTCLVTIFEHIIQQVYHCPKQLVRGNKGR